MGDSRFEPSYERIRHAGDLQRELRDMDDDEVVQALAAASTHAPSPYLANILASEAMNRLRHARVVNEHIADGVIVVDLEGRIRSINPASTAMLGYTLPQVRGRDLSELCAQTGEDGHGCVHRLVLEGRRAVHDAQDSFLRADGHVIRVSSTGAPVLRDGELEGAVVTWRDVTASLAARRALEESEARYRSLFDHSPDLVITLDREGRIIALNPAGERLTRTTAEEVFGQRVFPFIRPEDQQRAQDILAAAYAGKVRQGEFEVIQPDGTPLIYDALGVPIVVRDEVVGVHGVGRNITHLRRLEEGIRVSMARHELVMAGVKDHAVILLSRARLVESWNPGAERLFGWGAGETLGHPCANILSPSGEPFIGGRLDEADRVGRADVECHAVRKDGSAVYVSGTVNAVVDAAGARHGYVIVLRDTSPHHRADVVLQRALAVADALSEARDLLTEGVARVEAGRIVAANRAFLGLVGRARPELLGTPVQTHFAEDVLAAQPRVWTRAELRRAGGGTRDVEVAMRPIPPVEGVPPDGWILLARPVVPEEGAA